MDRLAADHTHFQPSPNPTLMIPGDEQEQRITDWYQNLDQERLGEQAPHHSPYHQAQQPQRETQALDVMPIPDPATRLASAAWAQQQQLEASLEPELVAMLQRMIDREQQARDHDAAYSSDPGRDFVVAEHEGRENEHLGEADTQREAVQDGENESNADTQSVTGEESGGRDEGVGNGEAYGEN